MVDFSASKATE